MTEEKVELSARDLLVKTVTQRLNHMAMEGFSFTMEHIANLIVDDLLPSDGMVAVQNRSLGIGMEAGYEKGLRDAIAAVGEVPRSDYLIDAEGRPQLIKYITAQRAVAGLSKRGLADLWEADQTQNHPALPEGSCPPT